MGEAERGKVVLDAVMSQIRRSKKTKRRGSSPGRPVSSASGPVALTVYIRYPARMVEAIASPFRLSHFGGRLRGQYYGTFDLACAALSRIIAGAAAKLTQFSRFLTARCTGNCVTRLRLLRSAHHSVCFRNLRHSWNNNPGQELFRRHTLVTETGTHENITQLDEAIARSIGCLNRTIRTEVGQKLTSEMDEAPASYPLGWTASQSLPAIPIWVPRSMLDTLDQRPSEAT